MRKATLIAAVTPALVGVFASSLAIANANRTVIGISIGTASLGGKDASELHDALERRIDRFLDSPMTLSGPTFTVTTTPKALGLSFDVKESTRMIWSYGRSGKLAADLAMQGHAFLSHVSLSPRFAIDETVFAKTLAHAFAAHERPARNATLRWNAKTKTFESIPEASGSILDRAPIEEALREAAATLSPPPPIITNYVIDEPLVTADDLPSAKARAEALLSHAPFRITAGDQRFRLAADDIAPWFVFLPEKLQPKGKRLDVSIDRTLLKTYLRETVAPMVNREPVDAKFRVVDGRVTTFALAKDGQMLLLDDAERVLEESILSSSSTDILLPVAVTKPTIGNDAAEELGIRELLGIGETDFSGSPPNRIHNIRVGAARFNGILVKPGEEFSFNALLGPVGPETGYKPELVIKQDKTVPEYGGGLCQVSTTAFRAAVFSGLPITERRNHAYIVRYYNPPGFDATIYPPHPDLRFINDTEGHILIQTSVSGTKLRFEFYGTSDGRNVEIIGPTVYDKRPDGSAKATLTVRVKGKDGSVREQIFRSTYKPPSLYPVERRNPLE